MKKQKLTENYLENRPLRPEGLNWTADGNGAVTLEKENTGLMNRLAQKLLGKPKVSYIHLDELGIRVPEELSVVGFDDIPLSRYTAPPLTTVRQNRTELGKSAFYALSSLMNDVPISTLLLHAELIVRKSSAQAPESPVALP